MDMVRPAVELRQQIADWISQHKQPVTPHHEPTRDADTPRDGPVQTSATESIIDRPEMELDPVCDTPQDGSIHDSATPASVPNDNGDTPQDEPVQLNNPENDSNDS